MNTVDYRRLYKEYYGIEFSWDMVVHHIDYDRCNNDINNLILIPQALHSRYHSIMTHLGGASDGNIGHVLMRFDGRSDKAKCFKTLSDVFQDAHQWMIFKKYLDVHMPTAILFASATCKWASICMDLARIIPNGTEWDIRDGKLRIGITAVNRQKKSSGPATVAIY